MLFSDTPRTFLKMYAVPAVLLFTAFAVFAACHKDNNPAPAGNPLLMHKWTLISRTATFPTQSSLNFSETDGAGDYFDFYTKDSVASYVTPYLPFSIDTASYVINGNNITFHDNRDYGIIFQHQVGNGVLTDTTTAQILALSSNMLVLAFPTESTIDDNGNVTYYVGTIADSLKR